MDIDDVFQIIGDFGIQQKLYFLLGSLIGATFVSGQMLQIVYSGAEPQFICYGSEMVTLKNRTNLYQYIEVSKNNSCLKSGIPSDCQNIIYTSPFTSIATEWDLICSDAYKVKTVQSLFMAGVLVGAFLFGFISDLYGRLRTVKYCLFFLILVSLLGAMAPSYKLHAMSRLLAGLMTGGTGLVSYVWATEFIGPSKRALCGIAFQSFFPFGIAFHSLIAYYLPYWRTYIEVSTYYGIIFLIILLLAPESPRWLVSNGKFFQAKEILEDIAYKNGTFHKLPKAWDLTRIGAINSSKRQDSANIFVLITNRVLRNRTLIQIYSWFVNSLIYYGLTLASGKLGTNLYITTTLSGLVEIPAYVITVILLNTIGRRKTLCGFMICAGLTCFVIELFPEDSHLALVRTSLALLGKMCISASFAVVFVHSAELYPTVIRNVGMGVTSVAARLGGIFAPFTIMLDDFDFRLQYLVLGILALSSGIFNLYLPETLNKPLPETIDDVSTESSLDHNDRTSLLYSSVINSKV